MAQNERAELLRGPIDQIGFNIRNLSHAREAIHYAHEDPEFVLSIFDGYTSLIKMLPHLASQEFAVMPNTQTLYSKLGMDQDIPTPEEMIRNPMWNAGCEKAHRDLALMMWKADMNTNGRGKYDKDETIYFGTLVSDPKPYIVGTMGHDIERWVVNNLASVREPWVKDDVLHAFNEAVMLQRLKGVDNPLYTYFTSTRAEGGLEWVTPEYLEYFTSEYSKPRTVATPEEIFLKLFEFFKTHRLPLDGLIKVALTSGCPNERVAQEILANLCREGRLSWEMVDGQVIFTIPEVPQDRLN